MKKYTLPVSLQYERKQIKRFFDVIKLSTLFISTGVFASYASDTNSSVMIGEEATPVVSSTQQVGKKLPGQFWTRQVYPLLGRMSLKKERQTGR